MFCVNHEERLAHAKCSVCGINICSDCSHVESGKVYCPECLPQKEVAKEKFVQRDPRIALILSLFPGLGQVYNDQLLKGLVVFFTSWLIIPWLYGVYDAYATACRINQRGDEDDTTMSLGLFAGCLVLIVLIAGIFLGGPFFFVRAVPNILRHFTAGSTEIQIQQTLEDISGAVQAYKKDHGDYPTDVAELYFGEIPYLSEMHCDTVKGHYRYQCTFNHDGYLVEIVPLKKGLPGYRMTPGPVVERF